MREIPNPIIVCQLVGKPKSYGTTEDRWRSAIGRQAVEAPIQLNITGFEGDKVADTRFHGSLDQAVCCHSIEHYNFWNDEYGLTGTQNELRPGAIGENWTLRKYDETVACVGDTFKAGNAVVQVSQPRSPCWKQEAKTGLLKLVERTYETLKTGFYMRVIEPGTVSVGDELILLDRPHPTLTIFAICNFRYHGVGREIAMQALNAPELNPGTRASIAKRLASSEQIP